MSLVEKCWMITSNVSVIAVLIITGICFGIFVRPYMKKKKEAIAVSTVYIAVMLVLYIVPPQIDNFSAYMMGIMAAFIVMYAEDRRNIYQKIFLAVTFFSLRWVAVAMAARLDDLITKVFVFQNTIASREWLQYGLYAGTRILNLIFCIVFIAGGVWLINKAFVYKKDEMSIKEMVLLMIPSLVGVTGYGILQYYLNIYEKDTGKNLIDTYGFYGALSFLHYLISIIAILVMIVMFQNWKVAQEEQFEQELVLNQVSDMEKHIGEVEKLYQDIRSLRHDMGNHIQILEHLVAHNNMDDAAEYVSGDDPYISISSFRKNSIFMITIKNSYQGELNYSDSDLPETTKSGKGHGIGLNNIRRVAKMYMGDISLEQVDKEVILSIMLQVE